MKTPKATVKLNAWQLAAIEIALRDLRYADKASVDALIELIVNAKVK